MFSTNQKNTLLQAIKAAELNTRDFTLTTTSDPVGLKLTYKPEDLHFRVAHVKIGVDQNRQDVMRLQTFSIPMPDVLFSRNKEFIHPNVERWDVVLAILNNWLKLLKTEFEQPDLWTEMEQSPNVIIEDAEIIDERFTPTEIKLLQERIVVVENQVIALELPQQAESAIVKVLRGMPSQAKRLTKKELWEILFSTILRESLRAGLTAEHTSDVIKTRYKLFHSSI